MNKYTTGGYGAFFFFQKQVRISSNSWSHQRICLTGVFFRFDGFSPGERSGWAYFKVISATELDVVFSQTGTCPTTFPSGAKRYYK